MQAAQSSICLEPLGHGILGRVLKLHPGQLSDTLGAHLAMTADMTLGDADPTSTADARRVRIRRKSQPSATILLTSRARYSRLTAVVREPRVDEANPRDDVMQHRYFHALPLLVGIVLYSL